MPMPQATIKLQQAPVAAAAARKHAPSDSSAVVREEDKAKASPEEHDDELPETASAEIPVPFLIAAAILALAALGIQIWTFLS